jgi:nucleotide-binding universal stress UspA family protein
VVGVDPEGRAAGAVVWAADEANRVHAPLRLVSAREDHPTAAELSHELTELARRLTRGELEHLEGPGSPASVIRDAAEGAGLVVVGRRSMSWLRRRLTGGTSLALAATAQVPVVVVPEFWVQPRLCMRPIVLGLAPTPAGQWGELDECARVIQFAMERAEALCVPLHVVSVTPVDEPLWRTGDAYSRAQAKLARELDERLSWWTQRYPRVDVEQLVAFAAPVPALLEASQRAQLVVVCRGTRFLVPHMLLGHTARALLRRTKVPVAVVPGATQTDRVLGS